MRTLSPNELDEVFAGESRVSATLPSVTVTAPHYSSPSSSFPYGGTSWAGPTYNESGGYCYQGAGQYFALSWEGLPNLDKVRCELNKNAFGGKDMPSGASVMFVNDYAFKNKNTGEVAHLPADNNPNPALWDPLYGQTDAAHNYVYIYAQGMLNHRGTNAYIDPETGASNPNGSNTVMTPFQHALLVMGHEAAHARGVVSEEAAEGYGVKALERYRAAPSPSGC